MKFIVIISDEQLNMVGGEKEAIESIKDNLEFVFDGDVVVRLMDGE